MPGYHLAQLNVGIATAPLDSDVMADFMNNLDRINALAESSPGFIWRLKADDGNATSLRPIDDRTLVDMSVWTDAQSLSSFVFRSSHVEFMRRRREWFPRRQPTELDRLMEVPRARQDAHVARVG